MEQVDLRRQRVPVFLTSLAAESAQAHLKELNFPLMPTGQSISTTILVPAHTHHLAIFISWLNAE